MNRGQAIADLELELSEVTSIERAQQIIQRALRVTGLTNSPMIGSRDMEALLQAIAAEGGIIQQLAEEIAINGLPSEGTPTGQDAA
jgi:hypothetical protein